jgi:hypothetical protein
MGASAVNRDCQLRRPTSRRSGQPRAVRRRVLFGSPLLLALSGVWGALLACSGDTTTPVSGPAKQVYWALQMNYHAINLSVTAPDNTVQLSATALTATGAPLTGIDSVVRYSDPDTSVTISPTGLVTAHSVTSSTQVIASLTLQGVTLTDTANVQITPTPFPAPLATFSIQPKPDGIDSAKYAIDGYLITGNYQVRLPVYATIATGAAATDTVCNVTDCALLVAFRTSNPSIATIDQFGNITPLLPGYVTLYASTWAYGITKQDSLVFLVGNPVKIPAFTTVYVETVVQKGNGQPVAAFVPPTLIVGGGASVSFSIDSVTDTVDVVFTNTTGVTGFEDSTVYRDSLYSYPSNPVGRQTPINGAVQQSDTLPISEGHFQLIHQGDPQVIGRTFIGVVAQVLFMKPGTYTYHSRKLGSGGTIIVKW